MQPAIFAVAENCTLIELPAGLSAVWVLNSSGGIGDTPNAPDVVLNVGAAAALAPQQTGERIGPGECITIPVCSAANGQQLPLYAVATGPNAQIKVELIERRW